MTHDYKRHGTTTLFAALDVSAVDGAKVKADVGTSHTPIMPRHSGLGNPMSGVEH
jgi:hypothetical protein